MTVRELIDKLQEIDELSKDKRVVLECYGKVRPVEEIEFAIMFRSGGLRFLDMFRLKVGVDNSECVLVIS